MTPPKPPPGKVAKGGMFKNLNPKQKRVLAVAGVGALLALIFLLSRRQAPEEAAEPQAGEAFGVPAGAGSATDPTAFLGAQSEVVGDRLADVGQGLGEVGEGLGEVGTGLSDVQRGQGELGDLIMDADERDQLRFDRMQARLNRQNRQLRGIRKALQRKRRKGGKNRRGQPGRKRPGQRKKQRGRGKRRGRKGNQRQMLGWSDDVWPGMHPKQPGVAGRAVGAGAVSGAPSLSRRRRRQGVAQKRRARPRRQQRRRRRRRRR